MLKRNHRIVLGFRTEGLVLKVPDCFPKYRYILSSFALWG